MNKIDRNELLNNDNIILTLKGVTGVVRHVLVCNEIQFEEVNNNFDFYVPEFKNNEGVVHSEVKYIVGDYLEHLDKLHDKYNLCIYNGVDPLTASYILPMAIKKDLIIKSNKEQLVRLTKTLLSSNIEELKDLGAQLLNVCPSIGAEIRNRDESVIAEIDKVYNSKYTKMYMKDRKRLEKVQYISNNPLGLSNITSEFDILVYYLMNRYNLTYEIAYENAHRLSHDMGDVRTKLIDWLVRNDDYNLLEQVNYRLEIPSSLLALQNLSKSGLRNYSVANMNKWEIGEYYLPKILVSMDCEKLLQESVEIKEELKNRGIREEDLIYLFTNANIANILVSVSAKDMIKITHSDLETNEEVKELLKQMIDITNNKTPLIAKHFKPVWETIEDENHRIKLK